MKEIIFKCLFNVYHNQHFFFVCIISNEAIRKLDIGCIKSKALHKIEDYY